VYGDKVRQAGKEAMEIAAAAAAAAQAQAAATPAQHSGPAVRLPGQVPLVLVVDDSITVRRVTQRLLQREGYRVALGGRWFAGAGALQDERPTVVLSDIEMPRMDGFDLARNIRARCRAERPAGHHDHLAHCHQAPRPAMELGANHYLGKPYSDEELLSLIRHYAELENAQLEA
jgi:chemosensory pili system protein ChpA (sensor histidine kinase/response regulator)